MVAHLDVVQVGAGKFAAIVSILAHDSKLVERHREMLRPHEELVHVTVEVRGCEAQEDSRGEVLTAAANR